MRPLDGDEAGVESVIEKSKVFKKMEIERRKIFASSVPLVAMFRSKRVYRAILGFKRATASRESR